MSTKEEILALARQSNGTALHFDTAPHICYSFTEDDLEAFYHAARKPLEHQLTAAEKEIADRKADCETGHDQDEATIESLRQQLTDSEAERMEQARLLGMSGEREAELLAQLAASQAREQQLRDLTRRLISAGAAINPIYGAGAAIDAIRNLPKVTLEDLK